MNTNEQLVSIFTCSKRTYKSYFVVPITFWVCFTMLGSLFAHNIFIIPVGEYREKFVGKIQIGLILMAASGAILPFLVGSDLEKRGVRFYSMLGSALISLGFILEGLAVQKDIYALYFVGSIIFGLGFGSLYISSLQTAIHWFIKHKAIVGGIFGFVIGIGGYVQSLIIPQMIKTITKIEYVYYIFGCFYFITSFPMLSGAILPSAIRNLPQNAQGQRASIPPSGQLSTKKTLKLKQFWFFFITIFCSMLSGWALLSCFPILINNLKSGVKPSSIKKYNTNILTSTYTLVYAFGRIFWGGLGGYLGGKHSYIIILSLQGLSFCLLPIITTYAKEQFSLEFLLIAIVGIQFGGAKVLIPLTAAENFGVANTSNVVGKILLAIGCSIIVGSFTMKGFAAEGQTGVDIYNGFFCFAAAINCLGLFFIINLFPLPEIEDEFPTKIDNQSINNVQDVGIQTENQPLLRKYFENQRRSIVNNRNSWNRFSVVRRSLHPGDDLDVSLTNVVEYTE